VNTIVRKKPVGRAENLDSGKRDIIGIVFVAPRGNP
jgi:hypothetical protein